MAMLPDEQYVLFSDTAEKKRVARCSHNKRAHCGKGGSVTFPSDFMSKKEREAMNSEVKSYNLNKPMTWKELRKMPKDLQTTYIKKLRNNYDVPDTVLAESFGVSQSYISQVLSSLGLGSGLNAGGKRKGWRKSEKAKRFHAWWSQGVHETVKESNETDRMVTLYENDAPVIEATEEVHCSGDGVFDYAVVQTGFMPYNDAVVQSGVTVAGIETSKNIPNGGSFTFDSTTVEEAYKMLSGILGESTKIGLRIDWTVLK